MSIVTANQTQTESIFDKAVCLSVELHKPGTSRQGSLELVQTQGADKESLRLLKVLWECEEFSAISKLDAEIRKHMTEKNCGSKKFLRSGIYLISHPELEETDSYLRSQFAKRDELIELFLAAYPSAIDAAREKLQEQFDEGDYQAVEEIREKFSAKIGYVNLGIPGKVAQVSELVYQRALQNEQARLHEATEEVRSVLRYAAQEVLGHLVERLQPAEDGKRKILREGVVDKVHDFLTHFAARNLTDDHELEVLVDSARELVGRTTLVGLRSDETTRSIVREKVGEIVEQIRNLPAYGDREFDF